MRNSGHLNPAPYRRSLRGRRLHAAGRLGNVLTSLSVLFREESTMTPSTRSRTAADTRDNQRITLIVAPRQSRPHLHEIALALSSRRDNHHFAATAKMAILFVAAFSHPDCRATLTQRAKVGAAILQPFDDFEEVAHRTGEAIEADDDEDIAGPDFAHQPGEFRPSPRRARPVLLVDCRAARRAQFVGLCVGGLILGGDP